MSDLSTLAGQAEHYAGVRRRLHAPRLMIPGDGPIVTRRYVNLPKVRMKPKPGAPFNFFAPPSSKTIIRLVGLKHGVSVEDIIGPRRSRNIVAARHEAIRLVKSHMPHLAYPAIGRIFNRDHTSILFALGMIRKKPRATPAGSYPHFPH